MLLMTTVDWGLVAAFFFAQSAQQQWLPHTQGGDSTDQTKVTHLVHDFGHFLGLGGVHEDLVRHVLNDPVTNRLRPFLSALVTVGRMKCSSSKRSSLLSWASHERDAARCCLGAVPPRTSSIFDQSE